MILSICLSVTALVVSRLQDMNRTRIPSSSRAVIKASRVATGSKAPTASRVDTSSKPRPHSNLHLPAIRRPLGRTASLLPVSMDSRAAVEVLTDKTTTQNHQVSIVGVVNTWKWFQPKSAAVMKPNGNPVTDFCCDFCLFR